MEPRQVGEWLGFVINTILMIFEMPVRKIEKLKAAIRAVLNCQSVPATLLVRIAGYLISLNIALGPIARFFTRYMYFVVAFRRSWRDYVYVSEHLSQELKFGLQRVDAFNGYHITLEDDFALQLLFIVTLAIQGLAVFPLSEVIAFVSVTGISLRLLKVLLARSLRLCCMFYNLFLPLCHIAKLNGFRIARTIVELFLWVVRGLSCRQLL